MLFNYLFFAVLLLVCAFILFRILIRNEYTQKSRLSWFSYSLEVFIFALHANFIYVFMPISWPGLPLLPHNKISVLMAILCVIVGSIILLMAFFKLGAKNSFGMSVNPLQTQGIYAYSRNPQLVGYGMMLSSIFILYPSWYAAGWLLLYVIICFFMIQTEEEFLLSQYKDAYVDYCENVPRCFGCYFKA